MYWKEIIMFKYNKVTKMAFTLIETLISLLILSIITIIVMSNFSSTSTHREDIRYFQSRVNISNRMEIIDSIKISLASNDITLNTEYTLNDIGYYTIYNGNKDYIVNLNYYPLSIQGDEVFLSYLDGLPSKPISYTMESIDSEEKNLPSITLADNSIYAGFYVRVGTDTSTNKTSIVNTFHKNIDTVDILRINNTINTTYHVTKNLQYNQLNSMMLLHDTSEITEYTREIDILNKRVIGD